MNTTQDTTPPATAEGAAPILPTVTLLTTEACHLCDDAHSELLTRVSRGQVSLHLVAAASALGRTLLASHRPAMFPLVLLDGQFFSAGRLPRRKLDRALASPKAS